MKPCNESEELKKFAAAAGNNSVDMERNERIIARFLRTDFDPQCKAKNRIRLSLSGQDGKINVKDILNYKMAVGVLAPCLIILALLCWPFKRNSQQQEISPDCYSYYDFASTGDVAMLWLKKTPPDWLDFRRFPALRFAGKK